MTLPPYAEHGWAFQAETVPWPHHHMGPSPTLKSLVSEHEPSALHRAPSPPRAPQRAPPVRDPLAGSHGATGRGRVSTTQDAWSDQLYGIYRWAFQVDTVSWGTPHGAATLKRLVSKHEPSALHRAPFPPRSAAHRRSAIRWPDRAGRRIGVPHEMGESPAVCGTRSSFSGEHSTWVVPPHGTTPPEKLRQRALSAAPPPNRRTAPPVRDPLAGSCGATDRGRACHTRCVMDPLYGSRG